MKKKLQKQMDSMMEMTMDAITNNKKLVPALNELFKYAPKDEKSQFILLHEIANQYLHELLDIDSEFLSSEGLLSFLSILEPLLILLEPQSAQCKGNFSSNCDS